MQSILRILKLNDVRKGVSSKTGKPYEMQDAECLLLKDTGEVDQVGVLQIPRDMFGKVTTGDFLGTFSLRPDMQNRRIQAVLVGLTPYAVKGTNINNEGDVINETTTSEESQTDCEKNPNALSCQELGTPPTGEIPREDKPFSIAPVSLPGGGCPAPVTFPIPGSPSFSWQPLCSHLPEVRTVVLVLASAAAAFIFVGGLKV